MSRTLDRRTLRKARRNNHSRLINPRTVSVQSDDLPERKRMETLWEQSIDFFVRSSDTEGDTNGKA